MSECPVAPVAASAVLYRLTFRLPASLSLLARPGRHCPCLMGCLLIIDRGGLVTVDGRSREAVLDQAARFLRQLMRHNPPPPTSIAAILTSPRSGHDNWRPRDGLQIIVSADISFAWSSIEAVFPYARIEKFTNAEG